jgi:hypothetical protein
MSVFPLLPSVPIPRSPVDCECILELATDPPIRTFAIHALADIPMAAPATILKMLTTRSRSGFNRVSLVHKQQQRLMSSQVLPCPAA